MPVRLKDIAKQLGISTVAVCKALKGDKDISEATRQRVLQRVKELNYQPNLLARGLSVGRSKAIGLVIPEPLDSFFAEIAQGVAQEVQAKGYTLLLANSAEDPRMEKQEVNMLLARIVDGLILASAQPANDLSLFQDLQRRSIPFVLLDRPFAQLEANFVGVDNIALGKLATEHLLKNGCRRVAHISCLRIGTGADRLEGYRRALAGSGVAAQARWIVDAANDKASGYEAMRKLLDDRTPPDGVFCFSDCIAAGVIKALLEARMRVPEDVSIVGAGNVPYSHLLRVSLTSVDLGTVAMGSRAAQMLLGEIASGEPSRTGTVLIPLKLVERESSRRIAKPRNGGSCASRKSGTI